jgi:hypothetical protein
MANGTYAARERLLEAAQELGAQCAREAYQQGLCCIPYRKTVRGLRGPLEDAFWKGVQSVDRSKADK